MYFPPQPFAALRRSRARARRGSVFRRRTSSAAPATTWSIWRASPTAMIFVPCRRHQPQRNRGRAADHLEAGCNVLLHAMLRSVESGESPMKILIARMNHETNTFSPVETPLAAFGRNGPATHDAYRRKQRHADRDGRVHRRRRAARAEIVTPISASANPSGRVDAAAYDAICDAIVAPRRAAMQCCSTCTARWSPRTSRRRRRSARARAGRGAAASRSGSRSTCTATSRRRWWTTPT